MLAPGIRHRLRHPVNRTPAPPLKAKILKGAVWMVATRWSYRLLGLISTMILARLLTPQDFGTVAVVMSLVYFVDSFFDFGFDLALIKDQHASREDYDTAWSLRFGKTVLFALVVALASPLIALYAQAPESIPIGLVVAGSIFIRGFHNIGTVTFSKDLEFHRVFKYSIYPRVLGVITTIVAAFVLRSYWAIVVGVFMNAIYGTVFSYSANPYWPRWRLKGMKKFWRFSKWVLIGNMGRQLFSMMDRLVLSGWISKEHLGFFTVAGDLASIVTVELFGPVSQALTPGFAKLQHDRDRLREAYRVSISVFLALIVPACTGVWLVAPELVAVILGDQWHDAAKFVALFSWFFLFFAFSEILTGFISMVGLIEKSARLSLARAILFAALMFFAFHFYSVEGIIWLKIALAAGESIILFYMAMRYLELSPLTPLSVCWRPALAAGSMALVVSALAPSLGTNLLLLLIFKTGIGGLTYASVTWGLWLLAGKPKGMELMLVEFIQGRLGIRLGAP